MPLSGQAKTDYQREYMRNKIYPTATDILLDPSVAMLDPVEVKADVVQMEVTQHPDAKPCAVDGYKVGRAE